MNSDIPYGTAGAVQKEEISSGHAGPDPQEKISSGDAGPASSVATRSGAPGPGGNAPLFKRLVQYQKERFPIVQHGPLIAAFTFSASTFSRAARGETGMIPLTHLIAGILTSLCFFFLLRVTDEYKDHEDDCRYRPYRPVPRGLIRLRELSGIAAGLFVVVVLLCRVFCVSFGRFRLAGARSPGVAHGQGDDSKGQYMGFHCLSRFSVGLGKKSSRALG